MELTVKPDHPQQSCHAQGFDDRYLWFLKATASSNDKLNQAGLGSVRHCLGVFALAFLRLYGARPVLAGKILSPLLSSFSIDPKEP